jgi:hypothetical protein
VIGSVSRGCFARENRGILELPMTARDLMAPDTEPTDEELAAVTSAAYELVVQRRALSDAWVAARLEEAARCVREQRTRERKGDGS